VLVERFRLHVENTLFAVNRAPSRMLNDIRHRVALVAEPQFPLGMLRVARVCEHPAVHQRAVCVAHHRPDVAERVWAPRGFIFVRDVLDIPLHSF